MCPYLPKWLGVLVLPLLLISCSKQEKARISIGINEWPGYEFLYLAEQLDLFNQLDVNVDIIEFHTLADAKLSFERGQIDGIACTLVEHCQILDGGFQDPVITLALDYSNGGDVVLANSSIKTLGDIRGKRIAVEIESLGVYMLSRMLDSAGLGLDDVTIIRTDQLSMTRLMQDELADICITYPPHSLNIAQVAQTQPIFTSADIPGEIVDILSFSRSILEERPEDLRKISDAFYLALQWHTLHPDEANAVMAEREGIPASDFSAILQDEIRLIGESDQEMYFAIGGKLDVALQGCDTILRATRQLLRDPRYQNSISRDSHMRTQYLETIDLSSLRISE